MGFEVVGSQVVCDECGCLLRFDMRQVHLAWHRRTDHPSAPMNAEGEDRR